MGETNQTIVLRVAADSGSTAEFSVTVDGTQVPGVLTTDADHQAGQWQNITLVGDFGANGPSEVDVNFLNDQNAGLFVQSIDVNGHVFSGLDAQDNANPFQVSDPTAAVMTHDGSLVFNTAGSPPEPVAETIHEDFSGSGTSDLLGQDSSGNVTIVTMQNGDIAGSTVIGTEDPNDGWHIVGTGDFDGDGTSDILWHNDLNGQVGIWTINADAVSTKAVIGTEDPNDGWHIVGTGDFDGDGRTDLLWHNDNNGQVGVWLMNGDTAATKAVIATEDPNDGWHIVGTGDFDGDGKTDLLWHNDNNGQVGVWLVNGDTVATKALIATEDPNDGWHIVGTGNFTGDGHTDILWRNDNGHVGLWELDGTSVTNKVDVTMTNPSAQLAQGTQIIGVGNYVGDGKADFIAQDSSGQTSLWSFDAHDTVTITSIHSPNSDLHLV